MFNLNPKTKYIVALSGGPDSIFLLNQTLKEVSVENIIACHVNYKSRPTSDEDQKIAEDYCNFHNIEFKVLNVFEPKPDKLNFESWAREIRYDHFAKIAKENDVTKVLVGHHLNDLIETYLMQKKRKNIIKFYGLAKETKYNDITIVRPMLNITRSYILKYLHENKINYTIDPSNTDTKYVRNKIRSELSEIDFKKYIKKINNDNLILIEQWKTARKIFNKNTFKITKEVANLPETIFKMYLIYFFESTGHSHLIFNSNNKILNEIIRRIQDSKKPLWNLEFKDYTLIQNFNRLYLFDKKELIPKTFIINNKEEFKKIMFQIPNFKSILQTLDRNQKKYPFIVTNDFENYKNYARFNNEKMNRFFINNKITFVKKKTNFVIYNHVELKILNDIRS